LWYYGGKVLTPNLDRMAREGMVLHNAHMTSTVCSRGGPQARKEAEEVGSLCSRTYQEYRYETCEDDDGGSGGEYLQSGYAGEAIDDISVVGSAARRVHR
jgi:hypothetical protein